MSNTYNGRGMDRSAPAAGSVRRARERAEASLPSDMLPSRQPQVIQNYQDFDSRAETYQHIPISAPTPPRAVKSKHVFDNNGKFGQSISRPTQVPQWPLPGPISAPADAEPYRPPPGRPLQAPQRPPRPSRIPSMVDQSRLQEPTPLFLNPSIPEYPQDQDQDNNNNVTSPNTPSSRQTTSSIGTIPDFPGVASARKNSALGPPPSSRRGASSFYSAASFVSPIIEENSRIRSNGSYASSAAMPEAWGASPSALSHSYVEAFYEESVTDTSRESTYDDFSDEGRRLVKSPVVTSPPINTQPNYPGTAAAPFQGWTGYMDTSTGSSNAAPTSKPTPATSPGTVNESLSPDAILKAYAAASSSDSADGRRAAGSPQPFNRLSAIRRPPRLDIDAVRAAEARGSLTSLPDLIKRATKLAAMIDKGRRPTSRMDGLTEYLSEKEAVSDQDAAARDRHQSGLSDMLAAFPPPVQTPVGQRQNRGSWLRGSPRPAASGQGHISHTRANSQTNNNRKKTRRCCGLPIWAFILLTIVVLCAIATAIVIPLEFFVFKNLGNHAGTSPSLTSCQDSLPCLNGGASIVSQNKCSCICTNGFTGSDCSAGGSTGCTTTNLVSSDGSETLRNVTLGRFIPRLIADAKSNFSIPLSGTIILAKLNSAELSCIAQNTLVNFNSQSTRTGAALAQAQDSTNNAEVKAENGVSVSAITVSPLAPTAASGFKGNYAVAGSTSKPPDGSSSATPSSTGTEATATGTFVVTQEVLDFSRIAVLFILQKNNVQDAEAAQTNLQNFFTQVTRAQTLQASGATKQDAESLNIGGAVKINLVDYTINLGNGPVGGKGKRRSVPVNVDVFQALPPQTPGSRVPVYFTSQ